MVTVNQILKANSIICVVPVQGKAKAVKCAVIGPISPSCPMSVLRTHANAQLFLDDLLTAFVDGESLEA